MGIDIVEICFWIADGQISSICDSYLPATRPYFHFWTINLVNVNGFSPNLVCALILWTSALGLLMGKLRPVWTELSARNTSVFYFQNNNSSNSQWIFTDFDMCNDIVKRYFGIAHCQISSIFDKVICPRHDNGGVLSFYVSFKLLSYTRTWRQSHRFGLFPALLRKHAYSIILKILQPKKENFQIKILIFCIFLLKTYIMGTR